MSPKQDGKAESHEKIRRTASKMIRRDGMPATSVHKVMQSSGMTVGGFYAHFESRGDMIREAFDTAAAERRDYVQNMQQDLPTEWRAAHFVHTYLTQDHIAQTENGCMWAALLSDLSRADETTRDLGSNWFRGSIDYFTGGNKTDTSESLGTVLEKKEPGKPKKKTSSSVPEWTRLNHEPASLSPRQTAISSMAVAFACLNLARMATDQGLRDEILEAGKRAADVLNQSTRPLKA